MKVELVILAAAAALTLAGSPPAGPTYLTGWRYLNGGETPVRLPAMVPVVISMETSGSDPAEEIVEFEVTAKFPDAMMANRLEDAKGSGDPAFWGDLECEGVPDIKVPASPTGPFWQGTVHWEICAAKCNPPFQFRCNLASNFFEDIANQCTCSAEEKAKFHLGRAVVATGKITTHRGWGHSEWIVDAPSPVRVLGSSMAGIVLETYLPAEAVGKEVGWRTVAKTGDKRSGAATVEARDGRVFVTLPACDRDALAAALTISVLLALALGAILAFFLLRKKMPAFRRAPTEEEDPADSPAPGPSVGNRLEACALWCLNK